jgi:ABC-2 type transport system permease protein
MGAIFAMAMKDLRLLFSDWAGVFFTFCFPAIYAVFFGTIYAGMMSGEPMRIDVDVVDADQTAESAALIEGLDANAFMNLHAVDDREVAADHVRRGRRQAYIYIPPGFGANRLSVFWDQPIFPEVAADPSSPGVQATVAGLVKEQTFMQVRDSFRTRAGFDDMLAQGRESVDQADDLSGGQRLVLNALFATLESVRDQRLMGFDAQPAATPETQPATAPAPQPATPAQRGPSAFAVCFPQGIVWGILACAATFATTIVVERTRGTLPRLLVAPISDWQFLAGKALACLLTTAAVLALMLLLAIVLGVQPDSWPLLLVAALCVAIGMVGLMMLMSVLGKTEQAVAGVSWAAIIVLCMFGGGMIPQAFMPGWMRPLSAISPVGWAIRALDGALWRGFSPAEMLAPCAALIAIGVGGFGIGLAVFRLRVAR